MAQLMGQLGVLNSHLGSRRSDRERSSWRLALVKLPTDVLSSDILGAVAELGHLEAPGSWNALDYAQESGSVRATQVNS